MYQLCAINDACEVNVLCACGEWHRYGTLTGMKLFDTPDMAFRFMQGSLISPPPGNIVDYYLTTLPRAEVEEFVELCNEPA